MFDSEINSTVGKYNLDNFLLHFVLIEIYISDVEYPLNLKCKC